MKPSDLSLLKLAGRPAVGPDGEVFVAVSTPDLEEDRYGGRIVAIPAGQGRPSEFTLGPRDSAPALSPDGSTLVFSRAGETGPAQLYAMPVLGGEPRKLTDHKLGASTVVFAPDGDRIAYLAPVPESGRYGTDEKVKPEGEAPRRIDRLGYRVDGKGFLLDKPEQLFVLDLTPGATPRQLTAEPGGAGRASFTPDGRRLVYARETGPDELTAEIAVVDVDADRSVGDLLAATAGDAADPVVAGDTVLYTGAAYTGHDFAGRSTGLWAVPLAGGTPRRLTDEATVNLDPGEPVVLGDAALVLVQNRGAVQLCSVPLSAENRPLAELTTVLGGKRVVKGFSVFRTFLAATVADPRTPGEVIRVDLTGDGDEVRLTDFAADLRAAGIHDLIELDTAAPDGYPVHGWLLLPDGDGPHPVLLNVHGGPHAQYGWGLFDEAQVYAAAGYAVVMGNPRGSSGYGQAPWTRDRRGDGNGRRRRRARAPRRRAAPGRPGGGPGRGDGRVLRRLHDVVAGRAHRADIRRGDQRARGQRLGLVLRGQRHRLLLRRRLRRHRSRGAVGPVSACLRR